MPAAAAGLRSPAGSHFTVLSGFTGSKKKMLSLAISPPRTSKRCSHMDGIDDPIAEQTHDNLPRIVAHWKRFACGLWRLPEGDISAAYCADTFPRLKAFPHEGRLYMTGGTLSS